MKLKQVLRLFWAIVCLTFSHQTLFAKKFHECILLIDPQENLMDSGGNVGALTSKSKLATYEEIPMITSGSIEMSGILASKVLANKEKVDEFQNKFGGIFRLLVSDPLLQGLQDSLVGLRKVLLDLKDALEGKESKIAQAFGQAITSRADVDFKACLIGMTNEKWYAYIHKKHNLILKIPKSYIERKVDTKKVTDPDEQVERCGFRVRGAFSELEKIPDVTNDALLDFLQKRKLRKQEPFGFIRALQSFFVLAHEDSTNASWLFYWSGHGGPVRATMASTLVEAEGSMKWVEEKKESEQTIFQSATAVVAGVSFSQYQEMLDFFRNSLNVAWLLTFNCFPGEHKQWFIEQALKNIKADFPVTLIGHGSHYVYSNIMGTASVDVKDKSGTKQVVMKFKYSFADYFEGLRLYFGDEKDRKEFVRRTKDVHKQERVFTDPLGLIIKTVICGEKVIDFNNQPFIYFPHLGVFAALGIDKKIKIITKLLAKAHEFNGNPIDVSNNTAALMYPSMVRVPLIVGDRTLLASELVSAVEKSWWQGYMLHAIRDYNQIHFFDSIEFKTSLDKAIYNLIKVNPSFYKAFLIKNLKCSNFIDSGIHSIQDILTINDVIILIHRAGALYTFEDAKDSALVGRIAGTVDIVGRIGTDVYSCTWDIKDFDKITPLDATKALRFKKNERLDGIAEELLREADFKRLKEVADQDSKGVITQQTLFNMIASIVIDRAKKTTDVQEIGALGGVVRRLQERQKEAQETQKDIKTRKHLIRSIEDQIREASALKNKDKQRREMMLASRKIEKLYEKGFVGDRWMTEQMKIVTKFVPTVVPIKLKTERMHRIEDVKEVEDEKRGTPLQKKKATYLRMYEGGWTDLHRAVRADDLAAIEKLIKAGANVNARDNRGLTPLHIACNEFIVRLYSPYNVKIIEMLIAAKANVNQQDQEGRASLHYAMRATRPEKSNELLQILLNHGAIIDIKDHEGETPLFLYCKKFVSEGGYFIDKVHLGTVRLLLEHGADVNVQHRLSGLTLMHYAVGLSEALVLLLLKYGADVTRRDNNGRTVLMSVPGYSIKVVKWLLAAGADRTINMQDKSNATALFCTMRTSAYDKMVEILLKCGADWTIPGDEIHYYYNEFEYRKIKSKDDDKQDVVQKITPLQIAQAYEEDNQRVIKLLQDWAAKTQEERKKIQDIYYTEELLPIRKELEQAKAEIITEQKKRKRITERHTGGAEELSDIKEPSRSIDTDEKVAVPTKIKTRDPERLPGYQPAQEFETVVVSVAE